jgi:hypothetical protein
MQRYLELLLGWVLVLLESSDEVHEEVVLNEAALPVPVHLPVVVLDQLFDEHPVLVCTTKKSHNSGKKHDLGSKTCIKVSGK